MITYNPDERWEIPKIGVPTIGVPKLPFVNVFGETTRENYEIVETDEPNLLWEDETAMSWEDGENILLENQKMKIWLRAER